MNTLLQLEDQRLKLDQINSKLFTTLENRKNLIKEIQKTKQTMKLTSNWDPKRELKIFTDYCKNFPTNTLSEDLIYSLIIETQASKDIKYPHWSLSEHLLMAQEGIEYLINPILLKIRDESKYSELDLRPEFEKRLKEL